MRMISASIPSNLCHIYAGMWLSCVGGVGCTSWCPMSVVVNALLGKINIDLFFSLLLQQQHWHQIHAIRGVAGGHTS
jgi:hypothetical protein